MAIQIWPKTVIPIDAFRAIHWAGFALCFIAVSGRTYIRLAVFRRLFVDDYLVLLSLACLLATSVLCQLYLPDIYNTTAVALGEVSPTADFWDRNAEGLRALLIFLILTILGLWFVKVNFLLFFRRIGTKVSRAYEIVWWVITIYTIGCGAATFGITRYACLQSNDPQFVAMYCNSPTELRATARDQIISCVLDVTSDAFILILPISILWRVRVTRAKRIILSVIFSMTLLTIALAITRGAFFHEVYMDTVNKVTNTTWLWFWYSMELVTSIIIACFVSFRTLFVQKEHARTSRQRRLASFRAGRGSGSKTRAKRFYDALLDTCKTLEGTTENQSDSGLPVPPSGHMSLHFSRGEWGKEGKEATQTGSSNEDSLRTLTASV